MTSGRMERQILLWKNLYIKEETFPKSSFISHWAGVHRIPIAKWMSGNKNPGSTISLDLRKTHLPIPRYSDLPGAHGGERVTGRGASASKKENMVWNPDELGSNNIDRCQVQGRGWILFLLWCSFFLINNCNSFFGLKGIYLQKAKLSRHIRNTLS